MGPGEVGSGVVVRVQRQVFPWRRHGPGVAGSLPSRVHYGWWGLDHLHCAPSVVWDIGCSNAPWWGEGLGRQDMVVGFPKVHPKGGHKPGGGFPASRKAPRRFRCMVAESVSAGGVSVQVALLRTYAAATLAAYGSALTRCSTLLVCGAPFLGEFERYCVSMVESHGSGSGIRTLLAGVVLLRKLGLFAWELPPLWWRLPQIPARMGRVPGNRVAASPAWFWVLCEVCSRPGDWVVVGACILSFAYGFRISEAAWVISQLGGGAQLRCQGDSFRFRPAKRPLVALCSRPLTPFLEGWFRFLVLVAPVAKVDVAKGWAQLVARAGMPGVPFHAWRRATAHAMFGFGVGVPKILFWCRWESVRMLSLYLGSDVVMVAPGLSLPGPPTGSLSGGASALPSWVYQFGLLWPERLRAVEPGSAAAPEGMARTKRPRVAE
ncbi:hypothetical protein M569_17699 [Genlisea aurea]|uniref:Uncharacterized protein n=1 Tax=Genlisea aurea TaxID=192259 RepID=S8D370_9LAMI|nr:hypothetical protein M569_17699 [Genlisea aurea]